MTTTQLYNLTETPLALAGLGDAGGQVMLGNVGDDPLFWAIGRDAPAAGEAGFPVKRGEVHTITVPTLPLWAWSPARSRLAATPTSLTGLSVPGATARVTMDAQPAFLTSPSGIAVGGVFLVMNVGGQPVSTIAAPIASPPDGNDSALTLHPGDTLWVLDAPTEANGIFAWTRRFGGSVLLLQEGDPNTWQV